MICELRSEIAEQLPGTGYLELFWSGENGRKGQSRHRLGSPPDDLARRERDLTPAEIRLGPVPPGNWIASLTCPFRLRGLCGDGWLAGC